jgi:soluble lytic murein transglycosylase-like protein
MESNMVNSMSGMSPRNTGRAENVVPLTAFRDSKEPQFPLLSLSDGDPKGNQDRFELYRHGKPHPIALRPGGKQKPSPAKPRGSNAPECPKTPMKPLRGSHYLNEKALPESVAKWVPEIKQAAKEFGVPPAALAAILRKESGGKQAAASEKGALGLTQILPKTFKDVAKRNCIQGDVRNPKANLRASAAYLRELNRKFDGDWDKTLGFYNGGKRGIKPQTRTGQTKNYVPDVRARFWQYMAKPKAT